MPRSPAGAGISGEIKWNFTTFLVDRNGNVVRFEPEVTPDSKEVISAIEKQLGQYPSAIVPTGHSAGKSPSSGWKLQFPKSRLLARSNFQFAHHSGTSTRDIKRLRIREGLCTPILRP